MWNCVIIWCVCSAVRVVFHAVSRRLGYSVKLFVYVWHWCHLCIGDNIHLAMLTLSTSYVIEFYHSRALRRKILYFGKFPQNTVDRTMLLSFAAMQTTPVA